MTSLCVTMTEEHRPVVIDCSGPQPQFHNAGELTGTDVAFIYTEWLGVGHNGLNTLKNGTCLFQREGFVR